jgi:hypothetical protein
MDLATGSTLLGHAARIVLFRFGKNGLGLFDCLMVSDRIGLMRDVAAVYRARIGLGPSYRPFGTTSRGSSLARGRSRGSS